MPRFTTSLNLVRPVDAVFDFLARSANLAALAAPDMNLVMLEGPERLHLGAILKWKARRWGLSRVMVIEVTGFEENVGVVETQREGPFPTWVHARTFEATSAGTLLTDRIDFDPPGGILGRLVTAETVSAELSAAFAFRDRKLADVC
jgi:ligand-binding SRPBCC domain-containing protein